MKIYIAFLTLCLASKFVSAQTSLWNTQQAYLGESAPGDTPKVFAPGRLAEPGAFSFDRSAFSADGRRFYYCTNKTWFSDSDLAVRYFRFEDNRWKGPMLLTRHYYAPTLSIDGETIYLLGGGGGKVSRMKRSDTGWLAPQPFLNTSFSLYDFMPTRSGTNYIGSNTIKDSLGKWHTYDISTFTYSTGDTVVRSLGPPVNTPGFDGDFFVAPDESYMIVSAKEQPDFECELWITFRKADKTWTAPVSLGPLINDGPAHRWGEYVSPDGKYLFYSHGHGPEDCAVLWVRFDRLLAQTRKAGFKQ